jgi:hypothetical protein
VDEVAQAHERLNDVARRVKTENTYRAEFDQHPERMLREAGLVFSDLEWVKAEVVHRAEMTDHVWNVRRLLDGVAERARLDTEYRDRLQEAPIEVLTEVGINHSDAHTISEEMEHHGPVSHLMCSFSCCRHPATDWTCADSVLV